ncbi:MAG: hypothetical protein VYD19_01485, partial [Myxococcota bacterium]|nr:hypothetical protein [Myxococcota bacterium]
MKGHVAATGAEGGKQQRRAAASPPALAAPLPIRGYQDYSLSLSQRSSVSLIFAMSALTTYFFGPWFGLILLATLATLGRSFQLATTSEGELWIMRFWLGFPYHHQRLPSGLILKEERGSIALCEDNEDGIHPLFRCPVASGQRAHRRLLLSLQALIEWGSRRSLLLCLDGSGSGARPLPRLGPSNLGLGVERLAHRWRSELEV